MKTFFSILTLVLLLSLSSCDDIGKLLDDDEDPNVIGGSTSIPINTVGNKFDISVNLAGKYIDLNDDIKVIDNKSGVITIKISADLSASAELKKLIDYIPKDLIGNDGKINTEIQVKSTSEGIQDNFNIDEKFFTIAKYDCKVGDKYTYTNSSGKKLVREVTAKSTNDDFPYGFMNIKVITVEQEVNNNGIKKFIYRVNHKFGLVHFETVMEDGSKASTYVYTSMY